MTHPRSTRDIAQGGSNLDENAGSDLSKNQHPTVLDRTTADRVLEWLRHEAPWKLRVESFYEQHELSLHQVALPGELAFLASDDFAAAAAEELASRFCEPHGLDLVDASAHRLSNGQTIRIHNDYIGEAESHRLLIQLNEGWEASQGGLLMLFGSDDPADLRQMVLPRHSSGFAFEIGPRSHHAVSATHSGERFTLVYTYRRRSAPGDRDDAGHAP